MDRRGWLVAFLGLATASGIAKAQSPAKTFRIGILAGRTVGTQDDRVWDGFFADLRELGYVEGRNVVFERRYYDDVAKDLPAFAADLARVNVDVIVTGSIPAPEAARRATSTIPIVMTSHSDPVGSGLVASLARPGGNVTGLSLQTKDLRVRQLQLLREMLPKLGRVAVLLNPDIASHARELTEMEAAARSLDVQIQVARARAPTDFSEAFGSVTKARSDAMVTFGSAMLFLHRTALVEAAAKFRLPTVYPFSQYAEAGGLLAYGPSLRENYRRAAWYVDRILKGAKPGDLPVEQASRFELVVNVKAANALGLRLPQSLLAQADRIIE
jgi:putative tryptophan/tyrosine transport system substrate-binding protein